ncbi:ribosome maturation factor RimP [Antrihabitans cavernicola]|uniref:Ribosome maturation factor RimP n=1 Tax=Antrihabitans cavernicola TaxID=2495913 RepID=A0A5A7SAY1_9NOCA|nr:ribosome maturation factor RimP [Spelaeibacter cavernicola]KAA0023288.1 ribosome maturation factor RimP [Spelaeibacter cavernicola]
MPIPSKERVNELVAELVARRGYDLEDVNVIPAGRHTTVRVMVDSDAGVSLDAIADLSRDISVALDDLTEVGETPYTLEVTTPGVERPLTHERHWRRARGRKVRLSAGGEAVDGRIGAVTDDSVDLVVGGKANPTIRPIALADITDAVVQVEFSPPGERELELAGGVAEGRPISGDRTTERDATELDDTESEGEDK